MSKVASVLLPHSVLRKFAHHNVAYRTSPGKVVVLAAGRGVAGVVLWRGRGSHLSVYETLLLGAFCKRRQVS